MSPVQLITHRNWYSSLKKTKERTDELVNLHLSDVLANAPPRTMAKCEIMNIHRLETGLVFLIRLVGLRQPTEWVEFVCIFTKDSLLPPNEVAVHHDHNVARKPAPIRPLNARLRNLAFHEPDESEVLPQRLSNNSSAEWELETSHSEGDGKCDVL
jgi:hypothetical protein